MSSNNVKVGTPNKLIDQSSPYLQQHALNPVNWFPWGDEAFETAAREDKPIFLSIGYSTCHWCHVMEHESFNDLEAAKKINEVFVPIKVDREERPDIDSIYMTVCQMMTGGGGWPLTILMTADKKPFFAGTYLPKEDVGGRAGIFTISDRVKDLWKNDRQRLLSSAEEVTGILQKSKEGQSGPTLDREVLEKAANELAGRYDKAYGGFSKSPKFPTPHNLLFLLRWWVKTKDEASLKMVRNTLHNMRVGGVYDHVGFGFHRYSTDEKWLLPHFEKMLYDQALMALAYIEGYQATGDEDFKQTAQEIYTYVLRDLQDEDGGFYSAEDADSEGEEGKFYTWTYDEILSALKPAEAALFCKVYNIEQEGNWHEEHNHRKNGTNIPHITVCASEHASLMGMDEKQISENLDNALHKLFSRREHRVHPHLDDKVLTDWNGLMIAALARGARVLGDQRAREAAERAANFLLLEMLDSSGALLHRYRKGQKGIVGGLDDYAFLTWGLLELYETTFNLHYLEKAIQITEYQIAHFMDDEDGGFFLTPDTVEQTLVRPKEIYDGALPSGNSVTALNLHRLSRMTAETRYSEIALSVEKAFSKILQQMPSGFTHMLQAVDFRLGPTYEVVIAGHPEDKGTQDLLRAVEGRFLPNKVVLFRNTDIAEPPITRIANFTRSQRGIEGKATAYICRNYNCDLPTTDVLEVAQILAGQRA